MIYEQDWLMRQIQLFVIFLWFMLTGERKQLEDPGEIREEAFQTNDLYARLRGLVGQGKICEAEDELFAAAREGEDRTLTAALLFYEDLNGLTDEELERQNFSREEIREGLRDICEIYRLPWDKLFDM